MQRVDAEGRHVPGASRVLAGLGWSVGMAVAFLAIAIASYLAGHATGQVTVSWLAPLAMGPVAIGGSVLVVWFARVKLNRRGWQELGLPRPRGGWLVLGALCGVLAVLAVAALEYALGWLHPAPSSSAGSGFHPMLVLTALVSSLGVGFSEELVFRGYVFRTLVERMPFLPATLVTGLIFGLVHFTVGGFSAMFVLSVVLMSTLFLAMRLATGSLWFPIGFHALWDWTQTYLVGLSAATPAHDPALVRVVQTGPAAWVGHAPSVESGLLFVGLSAVLTLAFALAGRGAQARSYGSSSSATPT